MAGQRQMRDQGGRQEPMPPSGAPGPTDWEGQVAGRMSEAESAGAYRFGPQAHDAIFVTPFGTGAQGGVYMNPGGSFWQWDGGLAVNEMPGEWSQEGVRASSDGSDNTPSNVTGKGGS